MGGESSKALALLGDVTQGLSSAEIKKVFELYDVKKKGCLYAEESMKFLEHYIKAKGLKVTASELLRSLDDGQGNIRYSGLIRRANAFANENAGPLWDAVLMVHVKAAKGLANRRALGSPDPICVVRCGIEERQTCEIRSTTSPAWNQLPFPMKPFDENDVIHFNIVSFHKGKNRVSSLGHCAIPVKSLVGLAPGQPKAHELKLEIERGDKKVTGSLEVEVKWGTAPEPAPVPRSGNGLIYSPSAALGNPNNPTIRSIRVDFDVKTGALVLTQPAHDQLGSTRTDILFRDILRMRMPGSHKLLFELTQDRQHRIYCSEDPDVVTVLTGLRMCLQTLGFVYPRPLPFQFEVPARALPQLPLVPFSDPTLGDFDKIVRVFGAEYFLNAIVQHLNIGDNSLRFGAATMDENACIGLFRALQYNTFFQRLKFHRGQQSAPVSSLIGLLLQNGYWHTLSLRGLTPEFCTAFRFSMFNRYTPPSLTFLDLADNRLGNAGIANILAGLQAAPFLRHLDLSNNECNDFTGLRMLSGIALNVINLSNNRLTGPSAMSLAELLGRTSYLQTLRVAKADIDINPLLAACIRLPYLAVLDISWNDFRQARDLLLLMVRSPALTSLTATAGPLGDILVSATSRLSGPLSLSISGGPAPASAFLINPMPATVRELDLSALAFGRSGVAYVASCLSSFSHGIEVLNLSNNVGPGIPSDNLHVSIPELCQLIQVESPLKELHLAGLNGGYGTELVPFLAALAICRLTRLNVCGNTFRNPGLEALGQALRKNRTLVSLQIDNVGGTFEGYQALRGCLYGNQKVIDLVVPATDVRTQMDVGNGNLQRLLVQETQARAALKQTYKSYGNIAERPRALEYLKAAKRGQYEARSAIQKLHKVIQEVDEARARNEAVFRAKQAAMQAKQAPRQQAKQSKAVKNYEKQKLRKADKLIGACNAIMPSFKLADKAIALDMKAILRQKPRTEVTIYQLVQCMELSPEIKRVSGNLYGQMCAFVAETRIDIRVAEAQQRRIHQMTQTGAPVDEERNKKYKNKYYERHHRSDYYDPYYSSYYYYNPYDTYYCFDGYGYHQGYGHGWHTHPAEVCQLSDVQDYQGPEVDGKDESGDKDAEDGKVADPDPDSEVADPDHNSEVADPDLDGKEDIVDMYAAAGPHDLPDEGPTGGGSSSAIRVGVDHELFKKAQAKNKPVLNRLQEIWGNMLASALAKACPTPVMASRKELYFCESQKSREHSRVTLVTQCSLDRLHCLHAQAMAWNGCLSVCIYLPSAIQDNLLSLDHALADVRAVHSQVEKKGACILDIALLYQDEGDVEELYPINMLRNVALEQARTLQIFVLDVDFIPSQGLCAELETRTIGAKQALVIPAFELVQHGKKPVVVADSTDDDSEIEVDDGNTTYEGQDRRVLFHLPRHIPREKAEMCRLLEAQKAEAFHIKAFAQGHANTNSERWAKEQSALYEVEYQEGYEPYVVVNKKDVPAFDERFVGYGMNKIQWLYHLNVLKFKFYVAPSHFVVAAPHLRSPSWKAAYGSQPSEPFHHMQIKMLYNTFKTEMRKMQEV